MIVKSLVITLFILILSNTAYAKNDTETVYTKKSYPYNLLVQRADKLKIKFIESDRSVSCNTEFEFAGKTMSSHTLTVDKRDFDRLPLASCLPRKQAKIWLSSTFN